MFSSDYLHSGSLLQFVQPYNLLPLKRNTKINLRKIMMWVSISTVHVLKVKHYILDKKFTKNIIKNIKQIFVKIIGTHIIS